MDPKTPQRSNRFRLRNMLSLKILLPILAISLISIGGYAASVNVTQTTYQTQSGVYYNVVGGFTAASNGFNVVQSSGAASTQPFTWANGDTVSDGSNSRPLAVLSHVDDNCCGFT